MMKVLKKFPTDQKQLMVTHFRTLGRHLTKRRKTWQANKYESIRGYQRCLFCLSSTSRHRGDPRQSITALHFSLKVTQILLCTHDISSKRRIFMFQPALMCGNSPPSSMAFRAHQQLVLAEVKHSNRHAAFLGVRSPVHWPPVTFIL